MAFKLADFIKETSIVTGNSADIDLNGAVTQYAAFSSFLANADTTWWFVRNADGSEWECRESAYISSTNKLARSGALIASSTGSAVNFTSGTKTVICGLPAEVAQYLLRTDAPQSLTRAQKLQGQANLLTNNKNYALNGAMMVSQENGAASGSASGYYPVDMFSVNHAQDGTLAIAQVASATPGGSPSRVRVTASTADASIAPGQGCWIIHAIEGYRIAELLSGTASAKTVALRFGVKAPAGTYCVAFRNSAINRSYVAEYVISAGEANTSVYKTVTVPLDVTGTWLADAGLGLSVTWSIACGSTYQTAAGAWSAGNFLGTSSQFNGIGTNGNVFELFDVGLYEGSVAPDFVVPDYASTLRDCQRYYYKGQPFLWAEGNSVGVGASQVGVWFEWPSVMRAAPTITQPTWTTANVGTISASQNTVEGVQFTAISTSGAGTRIIMVPASGNLIANARL